MKTLDWNFLIYMKGLDVKLEYEIISLYKKTIWAEITKVRFDKKMFNILDLCNQFEKQVSFYTRYIYDNG